jgi:hypothetical protein
MNSDINILKNINHVCKNCKNELPLSDFLKHYEDCYSKTLENIFKNFDDEISELKFTYRKLESIKNLSDLCNKCALFGRRKISNSSKEDCTSTCDSQLIDIEDLLY